MGKGGENKRERKKGKRVLKILASHDFFSFCIHIRKNLDYKNISNKALVCFLVTKFLPLEKSKFMYSIGASGTGTVTQG